MRGVCLLVAFLLLAGCVRAPEPDSNTPSPPPGYTIQQPLEEQGHLGESVFLENSTIPMLSQSGALANDGPHLFWVKGDVTALDVNLTWTPTASRMQTLELWVLAAKHNASQFVAKDPRILADLTGPPPLHVHLDNVSLDGERLAFFVAATTEPTPMGPMRVSVEQPFHLAGTIWTRAAIQTLHA